MNRNLCKIYGQQALGVVAQYASKCNTPSYRVSASVYCYRILLCPLFGHALALLPRVSHCVVRSVSSGQKVYLLAMPYSSAVAAATVPEWKLTIFSKNGNIWELGHSLLCRRIILNASALGESRFHGARYMPMHDAWQWYMPTFKLRICRAMQIGNNRRSYFLIARQAQSAYMCVLHLSGSFLLHAFVGGIGIDNKQFNSLVFAHTRVSTLSAMFLVFFVVVVVAFPHSSSHRNVCKTEVSTAWSSRMIERKFNVWKISIKLCDAPPTNTRSITESFFHPRITHRYRCRTRWIKSSNRSEIVYTYIRYTHFINITFCARFYFHFLLLWLRVWNPCRSTFRISFCATVSCQRVLHTIYYILYIWCIIIREAKSDDNLGGIVIQSGQPLLIKHCPSITCYIKRKRAVMSEKRKENYVKSRSSRRRRRIKKKK